MCRRLSLVLNIIHPHLLFCRKELASQLSRNISIHCIDTIHNFRLISRFIIIEVRGLFNYSNYNKTPNFVNYPTDMVITLNKQQLI